MYQAIRQGIKTILNTTKCVITFTRHMFTKSWVKQVVGFLQTRVLSLELCCWRFSWKGRRICAVDSDAWVMECVCVCENVTVQSLSEVVMVSFENNVVVVNVT